MSVSGPQGDQSKVETRTAAIVRAKTLRAGGLSHAAIAERLGVHQTTVWGWLNPDAKAAKARRDNARRGPAKRAWENDPANRGDCTSCGGKLGKGNLHDGLCRTCRTDQLAAARDERRRRIAGMWTAGTPTRQIADALGSTSASISVELVAMRKAGWDVPARGPRGRVLNGAAS